MKTCAKCRASKSPSDFYSDRSRSDGLSSRCKACVLEDRAEYRAANRKKLRENARRDRKRVPERGCWQAMIARCYKENNKQYRIYGGRGISVCERWRNSFEAFLDDMGPRPSLRHTVDRIDPNGSYTPDNCRWATWKQQSRNTRSNRIVTAFGKSLCLAEWAERTGVAIGLIRDRLELGWEPEKAISTPAHPMRKGGLTIGGETMSIAAWARRQGINRATIDHRLSAGLPPERAVFDPPQGGIPLRGKRRLA